MWFGELLVEELLAHQELGRYNARCGVHDHWTRGQAHDEQEEGHSISHGEGETCEGVC